MTASLRGAAAAWLAGALLATAASPSFAADTCIVKFFSSPTLNFGLLDPSGTRRVSASALMLGAVSDCVGQGTIPITVASTHAGIKPFRLKNTRSDSFIDYTFEVSRTSIPKSTINGYFNLTVNAAVLESDARNADAGTYQDNVILILTP